MRGGSAATDQRQNLNRVTIAKQLLSMLAGWNQLAIDLDRTWLAIELQLGQQPAQGFAFKGS